MVGGSGQRLKGDEEMGERVGVSALLTGQQQPRSQGSVSSSCLTTVLGAVMYLWLSNVTGKAKEIDNKSPGAGGLSLVAETRAWADG